MEKLNRFTGLDVTSLVTEYNFKHDEINGEEEQESFVSDVHKDDDVYIFIKGFKAYIDILDNNISMDKWLQAFKLTFVINKSLTMLIQMHYDHWNLEEVPMVVSWDEIYSRINNEKTYKHLMPIKDEYKNKLIVLSNTHTLEQLNSRIKREEKKKFDLEAEINKINSTIELIKNRTIEDERDYILADFKLIIINGEDKTETEITRGELVDKFIKNKPSSDFKFTLCVNIDNRLTTIGELIYSELESKLTFIYYNRTIEVIIIFGVNDETNSMIDAIDGILVNLYK